MTAFGSSLITSRMEFRVSLNDLRSFSLRLDMDSRSFDLQGIEDGDVVRDGGVDFFRSEPFLGEPPEVPSAGGAIFFVHVTLHRIDGLGLRMFDDVRLSERQMTTVSI